MARRRSSVHPFALLKDEDKAVADIVPSNDEAWAKEHTEESLLAAIDAFVQENASERTQETRWRSTIIRKQSELENELRKSVAAIKEQLNHRHQGAEACLRNREHQADAADPLLERRGRDLLLQQVLRAEKDELQHAACKRRARNWLRDRCAE